MLLFWRAVPYLLLPAHAHHLGRQDVAQVNCPNFLLLGPDGLLDKTPELLTVFSIRLSCKALKSDE